jgi:phage gp29-like protein
MGKNRRNRISAEPAQPQSATIAPWPTIDRYPTVLGSSLTLTYLSAVYRMATTGYRREYVDVLDELLERDPHAYACYSTRILTVAGSRVTCDAPPCEESEVELANQMAAEFSADFFGINNLRQSIAALLWSCYYGVQSSEIGWVKITRFQPKELFWIHSRRIAYPDPNSWEPRIWDLGAVGSWDFLKTSDTALGFGLDPKDHPNRFIFHAPQYRGDYPTRDGVGRETAMWSALKLMGARSASQFVERFSKPWAIATYTTGADGHPRVASDEDINAVNAATKALGTGNSAAATIPDSTSIALSGPGAEGGGKGKLLQAEYIQLCNSEISKAVLGNSDSVESGPNGSRSSTSERMKGQRAIFKYDAACIGDTLTRDLSLAWTRLNYPGKEHLRPLVVFHIEEEMTPLEIIEIAAKAAAIGIPVDARATGAKIGVDVVPDDAKDTLICRPLKPTENLDTLNSDYETPPPPKPVAPIVEQTAPDESKPDVIDGEDIKE